MLASRFADSSGLKISSSFSVLYSIGVADVVCDDVVGEDEDVDEDEVEVSDAVQGGPNEFYSRN